MRKPGLILQLLALAAFWSSPLVAQQDSAAVKEDSVTIQLVDADLRAAIQALGRYLDRPVIFAGVQGGRVTLETPRPVPRSEVPALLRGVLESQNYELVEEKEHYRVRQREPVRRERPQEVVRGGGGTGAPELFTIRLSHARAADVAAMINALYGRSSAIGELGARPVAQSDDSRGSIPPNQPRALPERGAGAGRAATLSGELIIVPDPRSNSLLVRANRADYELVLAAVKELDVRPLQVLIEVLIAEVRRDQSFNLGVGYTLPPTAVRGSTNTQVSGTSSGLGLGDLALKIMNLGASDVEALLYAGTSRGDVSIVSRPVILAANNESAHILVGSQRPFIQVSRSLPTDVPSRDQVVQYKDVGTQLTVVPTISADGYVMLDVLQEVNAATTETAFDAPVISTRSVKTQLLIRDGQTVVLGGLTDRQRDNSRGGIPILSSLPLVGGFFGRTSRRASETELLLFLTPRIIRTDEEAEVISEPLRERAEGLKR